MVRIINMAQIKLAQVSYPGLDASAALDRWIKDGLAANFSEYLDDPANTQELFGLNADNPEKTAKLLDKIKHYKKFPESLH